MGALILDCCVHISSAMSMGFVSRLLLVSMILSRGIFSMVKGDLITLFWFN
jgi:hypothetical protein